MNLSYTMVKTHRHRIPYSWRATQGSAVEAAVQTNDDGDVLKGRNVLHDNDAAT